MSPTLPTRDCESLEQVRRLRYIKETGDMALERRALLSRSASEIPQDVPQAIDVLSLALQLITRTHENGSRLSLECFCISIFFGSLQNRIFFLLTINLTPLLRPFLSSNLILWFASISTALPFSWALISLPYPELPISTGPCSELPISTGSISCSSATPSMPRSLPVVGLVLPRILFDTVGLLTPLLMLIALSRAPDISAPRPWPCSMSVCLGTMPSPLVVGAAEAWESRFLRAARLRIRE